MRLPSPETLSPVHARGKGMAARTKKRDAGRTIHGEGAFENVAIQDLIIM